MVPPDPVALFPMLLRHAEDHPGRAAIITPDLRIEHGELIERIRAVAVSLLERGFDTDAITAVTVPDEADHLVVSLALLCLGTPNLCLGSFDSTENHHRAVRELSISQLVSPPGTSTLPGAFDGLNEFWPSRDCHSSVSADSRLENQALLPDKRLIYCSTSGTTGTAKIFGRTMSHTMLLVSRIATDPKKNCVLRTSSVEHDASRIQQLGSIIAGRTAAILPSVTAETLAPFCTTAEVTEVHAGRYRLTSLLAATPRPSHRLPDGVRLITGGSRIPGTLRDAVTRRLTSELYVSYATSEIGTVSIAEPAEHVDWPEGVGQPVPGIEIELRDKDGNLVPRGEVGELWARKVGVPGGDGTALQPDWVGTGDLLSWPEEGPLIFHSRADDMMILNGINIFPGPIEDALTDHPGVSEAVVYPLPSAIHGQIPVAAVVLKPGSGIEADELMRYIRGKLGRHGPRQVQIVVEIPRTELGKPRPLALRDSR